MWLGLSSPSWTMSSARSVSIAAIPFSSRCSLRPVSWVAIDLTFTTSSEPVARTRSVMIRFASSESRAQWTVPPRAVTFSSNCTSSSGSRAITSAFRALPARRSSSQSSTSATAAMRLLRMVVVAAPRLARSWVSASDFRAASGGKILCPGCFRCPHGRWVSRGTWSCVAPDLLGARQDLGEMDGADSAAQPGQSAADVHQAGRVAGAAHLGAVLRTLPILSASIAVDVSEFFSANVPPKPQQDSAAGELDQGHPPAPREAAAAACRRRAAAAASGTSGGTSPGVGSRRRRR